MNLRILSSQHDRLTWLISEARKFDAEQTEMRAHWARYLCVLSSGLLENALREIYSRYARSCSSPAVGDFVESALNKIQNPKASRFLDIARSFSREWETDLAVFLDTDGNREAIDSIMANRHLIAHGKNSNITLAQLSDYLKKSVKVIEFIESQCGVSD